MGRSKANANKGKAKVKGKGKLSTMPSRIDEGDEAESSEGGAPGETEDDHHEEEEAFPSDGSIEDDNAAADFASIQGSGGVFLR
jgi:hypothetical protein